MVSVLDLVGAEARAREIVKFASQPENWYRVGETKVVPGDRSEYVLRSGTVRAVFTWTYVPKADVLFRHMTVSTNGGRAPHPAIVWTLAHMFGFTGATLVQGVVETPAATWVADVDPKEKCIVVQERFISGPPQT